MLEKDQILSALTEQSTVVEYTTNTSFVTTDDQEALQKQMMAAQYRPLTASLCYWIKQEDESYTYSSNFALDHLDMTLVPFGGLDERRVVDGKGMSFNVFHAGVPVQSYTVTMPANANVPNRVSDQAMYFKEEGVDGWSAGHLIPHKDSPRNTSQLKRSTLQLAENFFAEPHYWNCYQRSHIEKRYRTNNGVCSAYPVYTLWNQHQRVVKSYKTLPERRIADGVFYSCSTKTGYKSTHVYVPFLQPGGIVKTEVADQGAFGTKLDKMIDLYKVSDKSRPQDVTFGAPFAGRSMGELSVSLDRLVKSAEIRALYQGELFDAVENDALHHSAVNKFELAATLEYDNPTNKMRCALIFSKVADDPKKTLYLEALKKHSDFLLDACDAEGKVKVNPRVLKEFLATNAEEEAVIDSLNRLRFNQIAHI